MSAHFSLNIKGSVKDFEALEPLLTKAGVNVERIKPIQFSVEPPDTTVLIVSGMTLKALVACFSIYMRETKKSITLVRGHDYTKIENCTDEQIEKKLAERPEIFIEAPSAPRGPKAKKLKGRKKK